MKKQLFLAALLVVLGTMSLSCAPATQGKKDVHETPVSVAGESAEDKKDVMQDKEGVNDAPIHIPDGDAQEREAAGRDLQEAVIAQDVAEVQIFLKGHADIHVKDENGKTALMYAAQSGNKEIVQLLLDAKASVGDMDPLKNTPLFYAVNEGHVDVARLLLQNGANINAVNYAGKTPLMEAAALWHEGMMPMLLQFKPARDEKDAHGKTAFMHACENGRLQAVELLFDENVSLDMRDDAGKTALFLAVEGYIMGYFRHGPTVGHQEEVAEFLLKHKADASIKDNKGTTLLEMAHSIPDNHIIDVLKEYGVR